jgi:hypothetical protein
MQACWRLSENPPEIPNRTWPTIEVEFECWQGQDKGIEVSIHVLSMIFIA